MSVKVQSYVWDCMLYDGAKLLMLLALADFADDDGSNVFPSVDRLARKCRLKRRMTQYHLRGLESDGIILCVSREGGGRARARNYTINVPMLRQLADRLNEPPPAVDGDDEDYDGELTLDVADAEGPVSCETKGAPERTLSPPENGANGAPERTLSPPPNHANSATDGAGEPPKGATSFAHQPSLSSDTPSEAAGKDAGEPAPLGSDFVVPEEWKQWARRHFDCTDIETEAVAFVDHYVELGEQRRNWFPRWQRWIANGRGNIRRVDEAPSVAATPTPIELHPEWQRVLDAFQAECSEQEFSSWIKPIVFVERSGAHVTLRVPTVFMQGWVLGHYVERLREFWNDAVDDTVVETVEVEVGDWTPSGGDRAA